MPNTWLIDQTDTHVLVTRRKPVRWDLLAEAVFPRCQPLRLAHQIRQDMWRDLKKIKGFAPAVEITLGDTFHVKAGGRVERYVHPMAKERIVDLLNHPENRRRWLLHARDR